VTDIKSSVLQAENTIISQAVTLSVSIGICKPN